MKKLYCLLLLLIALPALAAPAASTAPKIGYVQLDMLMQSPASLEVGKKLQQEFSPRNTELQRLKKQIDDKEAAYDKEVVTMTPTVRDTRSKEISQLKLDFQQRQREIAEDFELRKREERAKLQDRINKAVAAVSQAEGYDLVVYGNAAYAGKKVDITDKVIKAIK